MATSNLERRLDQIAERIGREGDADLEAFGETITDTELRAMLDLPQDRKLQIGFCELDPATERARRRYRSVREIPTIELIRIIRPSVERYRQMVRDFGVRP